MPAWAVRIAEEDERGEPACRPEDLEAALVRIARIAERLPAELLAAARAPQLRRLAPGYALRQVRCLRRMAGDVREARLELAARGPVPADLAVSARALEQYDRLAPALEEAARGLMSIPRILKAETTGPVAQWQSDGLLSRRFRVRAPAGPPDPENGT